MCIYICINKRECVLGFGELDRGDRPRFLHANLRERRRTLPQASRDLYIMKVHASIMCICARDIIALVKARTRTGKFGQGVNEESYLLSMSDIELLKTKFRMSN